MSELTDRALVQLCTFERISKESAIELITQCQKYERALVRISEQPEPCPKQIAIEALDGDSNSIEFPVEYMGIDECGRLLIRGEDGNPIIFSPLVNNDE